MTVDASQAGLSFSETADPLGFSRSLENLGQRRMARLVIVSFYVASIHLLSNYYTVKVVGNRFHGRDNELNELQSSDLRKHLCRVVDQGIHGMNLQMTVGDAVVSPESRAKDLNLT